MAHWILSTVPGIVPMGCYSTSVGPVHRFSSRAHCLAFLRRAARLPDDPVVGSILQPPDRPTLVQAALQSPLPSSVDLHTWMAAIIDLGPSPPCHGTRRRVIVTSCPLPSSSRMSRVSSGWSLSRTELPGAIPSTITVRVSAWSSASRGRVCPNPSEKNERTTVAEKRLSSSTTRPAAARSSSAVPAQRPDRGRKKGMILWAGARSTTSSGSGRVAGQRPDDSGATGALPDCIVGEVLVGGAIGVATAGLGPPSRARTQTKKGAVAPV
jgi:hypothetical protein